MMALPVSLCLEQGGFMCTRALRRMTLGSMLAAPQSVSDMPFAMTAAWLSPATVI